MRAELASKGHSFATASDTEAIIEGWRAWGPDVVDKLRGQFAFASWDHKSQTLFFARDRMGEKPITMRRSPTARSPSPPRSRRC